MTAHNIIWEMKEKENTLCTSKCISIILTAAACQGGERGPNAEGIIHLTRATIASTLLLLKKKRRGG